MDNVLVDFPSGIARLDEATLQEYDDRFDEVEGIFALMEPMPGAIEAVTKLAEHFDIYILSTAPWNNPSAWSDKVKWVQKYLPLIGHKRLILTHNKHLNNGHYLIDDRLKNGADRFTGEHIHFGQVGFESWDEVVDYLFQKEKLTQLPEPVST